MSGQKEAATKPFRPSFPRATYFRLAVLIGAFALVALDGVAGVRLWRAEVTARETTAKLASRALAQSVALTEARVALERAAPEAAQDILMRAGLASEADDLKADLAAQGLNWARTRIDARAKATQLRAREAGEAMARAARSAESLAFTALTHGLLLGLFGLWVTRALSAFRDRRLTNFDQLTGLPNRVFLRNGLRKALERNGRSDKRLALLSIELDRFKQVNDTLGHSFGDRVLCEAAQRILQVTRKSDVAARFGGDEFVMMLSDVEGLDEVKAVAERIVEALGAPYDFDGRRALSGASVGIAMAPEHGREAEELLRNAGLALYQAKADGKGRVRVFEESVNISAQTRRLMEIDLREAIQNTEIETFFQPVIDVASGEIVACEALARWRRSELGFVSPAVFIPLAEDTGLIDSLGEAVLRFAVHEAVTWTKPVVVSVNLSARQFQTGDLVDIVKRALIDSALPPERLELEITESILIGDTVRVRETLNAFRHLGVRIALDDFGAGYSSLSYLTSFPFDRIKIDRSFVTDVEKRPEAAAIVRAVTSLAVTLGMSTTAEGVETLGDLDWLRGQSCDLAQGFLVSQPVSAEEFRQLLSSWRGKNVETKPAAAA